MDAALRPVSRKSLADDIATRVRQFIQRQRFKAGDRLPSIAEMARTFGVGAPTVREALTKLEAVGVLEIRHGAGVFVAPQHDSLVLANVEFAGAASKKLLLDLLEARTPIEVQSATLAARHATAAHLAEMRRLLDHAGANLDDAALLNQTNLAFHREIAAASGNVVLRQILEVLTSLFREEQRMILDIKDSRREDHAEHMQILQALERHDDALAAERMREHLEGVRHDLLDWDPVSHPILHPAHPQELA